MNVSTDRAAAGGLAGGWLAWILAHMPQINSVLQALAFLAAICASVASWRYYRKRTR